MGKWHRTPSLEMAAHMVMLAPLCPGTVIVALSPYFTEIEAGFISLNEDICATLPTISPSHTQTPLPRTHLPLTLTLICFRPLPFMLAKNNSDAAPFKACRLIAN